MYEQQTSNPANHRCNEFGGAILEWEHEQEEKTKRLAEQQIQQQNRS